MTTEITLRGTKGAPLTHDEVDQNFANLKETADLALAAVDSVGGKANASALGTDETASNMGTTPGSILSDNGTAKQWFQEGEAAIEERPTSVALAADDGSALGFLQSGTGAVARTMRDKGSDTVSVKDFGTSGAKIADAIAAHQQVEFPTGAYSNTTTSITFPFGKTVKFQSGASLSNSGSGSATYAGVAIREGYNPSSTTGWTDTTAAYSYEGLSVEMGGYGPRQFGTKGTPTAVNGSINIPSTSTIANHASGLSGYAKSASTTTGGVAIYGEANRTADDALIWGFNTRTQDGGYGGLNVWGYEMDMNVDNITTTAVGFDAVGASSVEPAMSIAYLCQPIGIFASPKKRWQFGFRTTDGAAVVGMEIGAQGDTANSASQEFRMNYRNASNVATTAISMQVSSGGDASLIGGVGNSTLFAIKTPGAASPQIQMFQSGIGFFGGFPAGKPTVTGSRGGNAALASLLTALAGLGLLTDSSSA